MSIDLQLMSLVDDIQVLSITKTGEPSQWLVHTGPGLESVTSVYVNDSLVEFWLVGQRTALIVVPAGTVPVPANTVFTSSTWTNTRRTRVLLGVPDMLRHVSGTQKLAQTVIFCLFTDQGSDRKEKGFGVGLLSALSRSTGGDLQALNTRIVTACASAVSQLQAAQARTALPPAERLRSLTLLNTSFDADSNALTAVLQLSSYSETISVPLVF